MTAVFYRLQAKGLTFPPALNAKEKDWIYTSELKRKESQFFCKLAENHFLLAFDYSAHCMGLAKLSEQNRVDVTSEIVDALRMAEVLEHLYLHYISIPHLAQRYRRDQEKYREVLKENGYKFSSPTLEKSNVSSYSSLVRENTAIYNLPRLFTIRVRRLLLSTRPYLSNFPALQKTFNSLGELTDRPVAYLGWMYFTPRLMNNTVMTLKHVLPGCWLCEHEKALDWQTRLKLQWERRWFEFGNDAIWAGAAFVNCFVLVGPLAPTAFYLSLGLQVYDVFLAAMRLYIEIGRLTQLVDEYESLLSRRELTGKEKERIHTQINFLKERIIHEQRRFVLNLVNTVIMVLACGLTAPFLQPHPVFALAGGMMGVLTTAMVYCGVRSLEANPPTNDNPPAETLKLGIFGTKSTKTESDEPENPHQSNP